MKTIRNGVGLAAALAVAAGCGSGTGAVVSPMPTATATQAAAARCAMTLTTDPYEGFHIGVPDGWDLIRLQGTLFVTKDYATTEAAAVRPALMTAGLTVGDYFQAALATLVQQLGSAGLATTPTVTGTNAKSPSASLSIQSAQGMLIGEAHAAVLPFTTAHGDAIVTLVATWAPQSQFATDRSMLAGIGACYGPEPAGLYQVVKDQAFTYAIPVGWQTASETQDTIEIDKGTDAGASFTFLQALPLDSGVSTPQSLIDWAFPKLSLQIGQVVGTTNAPDQTTALGATSAEKTVEFIGTLNGRQVHAFAFVQTTSIAIPPPPAGVPPTASGYNTSGSLRIGFATTDQWNAVNGALIHIVGSIQHNFTQDLQEWERISQQQQAFGQQVQGFDYALTGVDLVHDPTTGATFEAPYANYNQGGPAGPGYYSPAGNKLDIQTP